MKSPRFDAEVWLEERIVAYFAAGEPSTDRHPAELETARRGLAAGEHDVSDEDSTQLIFRLADRLEACVLGDSLLDRVRGEGPPELVEFANFERIGHGGIGRVWRADQPVLGRQVAIKTALWRDGAAQRDLDRIEREVEAVVRLQRPGIVALHQVVEGEQGVPFLVMEYVDGETLHALLLRVADGDSAALSLAIRQPQLELCAAACQIARDLLAAIGYGTNAGSCTAISSLRTSWSPAPTVVCAYSTLAPLALMTRRL